MKKQSELELVTEALADNPIPAALTETLDTAIATLDSLHSEVVNLQTGLVKARRTGLKQQALDLLEREKVLPLEIADALVRLLTATVKQSIADVRKRSSSQMQRYNANLAFVAVLSTLSILDRSILHDSRQSIETTVSRPESGIGRPAKQSPGRTSQQGRTNATD